MVSLLGSLLLGLLPATAGTVAYWRFEAGPEWGPVTHGGQPSGSFFPGVLDSSGNGNDLSVWAEGDAGYAYRVEVPSPTIPQTCDANSFSVKNTGAYPCMWNNTLRSWTPVAFTIEASFKPENNENWGGWRTIVGRDSLGASAVDLNAAALYFQITPWDSVRIIFQDAEGHQHMAESVPGLIKGFDWSSDPEGITGRWYSMAGVSDGETLSLYLNDFADGRGYQLVAQTDLTLSGSANTALTAGLGSGGDWTAGDFSVGRGLWSGGHVDRAYGYIDEVRLTDGALTPEEFLFAPSPDISSVAPSPSVLWPPNHQMLDVVLDYAVNDKCQPAENLTTTVAVTSNEPVNGLGDGDRAPDWQIVDAHRVRLRAERSGTGAGRVYTITVTCKDSAGNAAVATTQVFVPKSQGRQK